jgi:hypothetical protein
MCTQDRTSYFARALHKGCNWVTQQQEFVAHTVHMFRAPLLLDRTQTRATGASHNSTLTTDIANP